MAANRLIKSTKPAAGTPAANGLSADVPAAGTADADTPAVGTPAAEAPDEHTPAAGTPRQGGFHMRGDNSLSTSWLKR